MVASKVCLKAKNQRSRYGRNDEKRESIKGMTPETGFIAAVARAKHLLQLYELICDTRKRGVRADWSASFKQIMHWPSDEKIVRVDGKNRDSILLMRESCGIDREHFAHDYSSELLRSAVVASVSAIDRLLHDLIIQHSWKLLTQKEADIPKKLQAISISVVDTKKALDHLRRDKSSRPGNLVKQAIQEKIHRDFTFQTPDSIFQASQMLGIKDFWGKVVEAIDSDTSKSDLLATLSKITKRRNQIVHEADLIRTSRRDPSLREISYADAEKWVNWMASFGLAVSTVVKDNV